MISYNYNENLKNFTLKTFVPEIRCSSDFIEFWKEYTASRFVHTLADAQALAFRLISSGPNASTSTRPDKVENQTPQDDQGM